MRSSSRPHPPALAHGTIREVLPGIHFVTGTVRMKMPPVTYSRNMVILAEGGRSGRVVLVNSVRLDEAGLASLDALGKVWLARRMMPWMGFVRPYNVGPLWLKECKPPREDLRGILGLEFANVLPAHGDAVIGGAREHYRPAVERAG